MKVPNDDRDDSSCKSPLHDPGSTEFLDVLARGMIGNCRPFPTALAERMTRLTEGIPTDPGEDIDGPVSL